MHVNSYNNTPCPYCGRVMDRRSFHLMPTRDHVVPRSRGGTEKIVCCRKCNSLKSDMMPTVWAAYMAANPQWWLLTKAERRLRRRLGSRLRGVADARGNVICERQGSAPLGPVVVPPALIFGSE